MRTLAACLALAMLQTLAGGCVSSSVRNGAIIGAASGAAAGGGVGVLVSDEDLLGSSSSPEAGDIALSPGSTVAGGIVMGLVLGAVIGAMVGHVNDDTTRPWHSEAPAGEDAANGPAKLDANAAAQASVDTALHSGRSL